MLLFAVYALLNKDNPAENEITISEGQIEDLTILWMQKWNKPPTDEELKSIIEDHVEEEVLYREALKLRLEEDDKIVRRRLAQKLDFIITDDLVAEAPTEEELKKYFEQKKEQYREAQRYSFYQIVFLGGAESKDKALELKSTITVTDIAQWKTLGDQTSIPFDNKELTRDEIDRMLGEGFSEQLKEVKLTEWQGPLQSGLGYHLINIYGIGSASIPEFESVKSEVEEDWTEDEKQKLREDKLKVMRESYNIEVQWDQWKENTNSEK